MSYDECHFAAGESHDCSSPSEHGARQSDTWRRESQTLAIQSIVIITKPGQRLSITKIIISLMNWYWNKILRIYPTMDYAFKLAKLHASMAQSGNVGGGFIAPSIEMLSDKKYQQLSILYVTMWRLLGAVEGVIRNNLPMCTCIYHICIHFTWVCKRLMIYIIYTCLLGFITLW